MKNYLDSIIQNSTALKSSLFRGGGIEMGEGIPSILPLNDLPKGNVSASPDELNQKNAEIASLTSRIAEKDKIISDLEAKVSAAPASTGDSSEEVEILQSEVG